MKTYISLGKTSGIKNTEPPSKFKKTKYPVASVISVINLHL